MEFEFEDDLSVRSFCASEAEASVNGRSCTDEAVDISVVNEQTGRQEVGEISSLPEESLLVSRKTAVRIRAYRELQEAFHDGHTDSWKFFPWFREMLGESDDDAFAGACAAIAAHYRDNQASEHHQLAPLTWLGVLAERLLRADSATSKVALHSSADLVASVLLQHSTAVWEEIRRLLKENPSGALRLLCLCSEQGLICAEEVWPLIRESSDGIRCFLSRGNTTGAAVQLRALCDLLPTIEGKLSLQLGIMVHGDQSVDGQLDRPIPKPARKPARERIAESPSSLRKSQMHGVESAGAQQSSSSRPTPAVSASPSSSQPPEKPILSRTATSPEQSLRQRSGWDWDDRLATSPVLPKGGKNQDADQDVLRVLSTASPRSWRERLQCLEGIDGFDSDGLHGPALLPHLVLQAEDTHPKVAMAAYQAISRIAMQFDSIGDFLVERLSVAIRNRLREGQARFQEAVADCLTSFIRHAVLVGSKLDSFLMQATGCTSEAARAAVAGFHAEGLSTPRGFDGIARISPALEQLLRGALSPRRAARRKSGSMALTNTPGKSGSRPGSSSRPSSKPCTPQRSSPSTVAAESAATVAVASPRQKRFSPAPRSAHRTTLHADSPVQRSAPKRVHADRVGQSPLAPRFPVFSRSVGEASRGACSGGHGGSESSRGAIEGRHNRQLVSSQNLLASSLRTPPRSTHPLNVESSGPLEKKDLFPEDAVPYWERSPLPPTLPNAPPSLMRVHDSRSEANLQYQMQDLNTPIPRSHASQPSSSTPKARDPHNAHRETPVSSSARHGVNEDSYKLDDAKTRASSAYALQRAGVASSACSLAGPNLYGDSRLLSPSRVSDVPSALWHSPMAEKMPSFPEADDELVSPPATTAAASSLLPVTTPSIRELHETDERVFVGSELRTPIPWMSSGDDSSIDEGSGQKSFLVSPPSTSNARVKRLLTAAAAGLNALEAGGDPSEWHEALRALAAWQPGKDGVRGEAAAEAVVGLLLDAAPRLRNESLPEIWRALSELRDAPWLSETAVLELSLGHCLSFTEPSVVAAFLVARVASGRLSVTACLDGCLARLCKAESSTAKETVRFVKMLETVLEAMKSREMLGDLSLPCLPELVEWASPRRVAALAGLRSCLETLLRYASPAGVSEPCWSQLFHLLADCQEKPASAVTEVATPQYVIYQAAELQRSGSEECDNVICRHEAAARIGLADRSQLSDVPEEDSQNLLASSDEASELHKLFARLHRLMGELAKAEGSDIPIVLQDVAKELRRQEAIPPLRAFLQRLLVRQRSLRKENVPPHGKSVAAGKDGNGEFIDNDYASIREVAHCEGLQGTFPHTLLAHLKRLLAGPAAANTRRAGLDCLNAIVSACGCLLLRVVLQLFVASGILLHAASTRGPAQSHARGILTQLTSLRDHLEVALPSHQSLDVEDCSGSAGVVPRYLRMVWRALSQGLGHRSSGAAAVAVGVVGEPGQLAELLRWLSDDLLAATKFQLSVSDCREILMIVAPALRDRSTSVRAVATRATHSLARARGGEDQLREDVQVAQLPKSFREDVLSCLSAGPPPIAPTFAGLSRSPSTPGFVGSTFEKDPMSPFDASFRTSGRSNSRDAPRRTRSTSQPRRLRFSPQVDRTPAKASDSLSRVVNPFSSLPGSSPLADHRPPPMKDVTKPSPYVNDSLGECSTRLSGMSSASRVASSTSSMSPPVAAPIELVSCASSNISAQMLEAELSSWCEALSGDSKCTSQQWCERIGALPGRLESVCLRHSSEEVAPLVPAILLLCRHLVRRGGEAQPMQPDLLESALTLARAARICFGAQIVQHLSSASAVACFRSSLQALSQLQQVSTGDVPPPVKRSVAPLLLELPPILAGIIDHLDASVQLIAWIRVAAEVVEEVAASRDSQACVSQGWALRFCARCVDRLAVQLPPGGADFPAWEVLSEVMRFHERHQVLAWTNDDYDVWRQALEGAARAVSRQFPEQAREFLRLATCTGMIAESYLWRDLADLAADPSTGRWSASAAQSPSRAVA
mmetsp:Transcript_109659/g.173238  ORF Transcript_109659/g.173238 Transcript_109659/m.173238 type:complete len:2017 (-) Transcript_109659:546-6596(-)